MSDIFIGREAELSQLQDLYNRKKRSLVVGKGRRRVGKSRLIAEFAKRNVDSRILSFAGLAPREGVKSKEQMNYFANQLAINLDEEPYIFTDWTDGLENFSKYIKDGDIILFDEISWMGSNSPSFISKLKAWWDKQEKFFVLILCGSVSTWIEDNILKSTAFFGRINLTITLEPFNLRECAEYLRAIGFKGSNYDAYRLLVVIGGIPWYLEQVDTSKTVESIIKNLCFIKDGLLVNEFEYIFHDLFNVRSSLYKSILTCLKTGARTQAEIREELSLPGGGTLSNYLQHLISAGFVQKQPQWSFKTKKLLKKSLHRISDPYIRFYLKFIEKNLTKINNNDFIDVSLNSIAGIDTHIGLQLEHLLLQNRRFIIKSLGINPIDIVSDGTYRQSKNSSQAGCQIDYLIQTSTNTIYICEFKFKLNEVKSDIINEVENKVKALNVPVNFAKVPVLLHIGGVASSVYEREYFFRIIDIADYIQLKAN